MSLTVSTKSYTEYRTNPDAIAYAGPANTMNSKDTIEFKRVFPKPTATFAGVGRPTVKVVRSVTIGSSVVDMILNISGSIPVGTAQADIEALLADAVSLLGSQPAEDLFDSLVIRA